MNNNYEEAKKLSADAGGDAAELHFDPAFRAGEDCVRPALAAVIVKAKKAAELIGIDPPRDVEWKQTLNEFARWETVAYRHMYDTERKAQQ